MPGAGTVLARVKPHRLVGNRPGAGFRGAWRTNNAPPVAAIADY